MSLIQSSDPVENSDFHLKLLTRLKVFEGGDSAFTANTSLLTSSNKYGLVFVGSPTGFQVIILSSIVGVDFPNGTEGVTNYPRREVSLPSQPSYIGVSCDQLHLVVAIRKSESSHALIYSVPSFMSQNVVVVNEVRLSPSPNVVPRELSWNPGIANMLASCMSDGTVAVYEFLPTGVNLNSIPPESRSTCLCWSPKGKQLVVGSDEGTLTQYKPDLKAVKTLGGPPVPNRQFSIVNIIWLSSFQFAAVYKDKSDTDRQALMIVNTPKGAPMAFVNYDDICYSSGKLRSPQFYLLHQQQWNVVVVGSGNSVDIAVLGLGPDQNTWVQWLQEDSSRAELPLAANRQETYLIGMDVEYGTTYKLPWGENKSQAIGPYPILLLLSHYGVLSIYNMLNLRADAGSICAPPEQPQDLSGLSTFTTGVSTQAPPPSYTSPPPPYIPNVPQITSPAPAVSFGAVPTVVPQATPNLFGALTTPASTANLFGASASTPSMLASLGSVKAMGASPSIFGGPAISTQAPALFGALALPTPSSTTGLFGGLTATQSPNSTLGMFGAPANVQALGSFGAQPTTDMPTTFGPQSNLQALSFGAGAAITQAAETPPVSVPKSGFSFSNPASSVVPNPTPSFSLAGGDTTKSTASAQVFGGSGAFSFGGGFAAGAPNQSQPLASEPKQASAFGSGSSFGISEQPKQSTNSLSLSTPSQQQVTQSQPVIQSQPVTATIDVSKKSQLRDRTDTVDHQPTSLSHSKSSTTIANQSQQSQNNQLVTGSEANIEPPKEDIPAVDNTVFIAAIGQEMSHFEAELSELISRVNNINIEIGTEEEKGILRRKVQSLSEFVRELKETTKGQGSEISGLQAVMVEAFAWIEEARSREKQYQSPRYQQLIRSRELDPGSARRLSTIQHLVYYVDSQLRQVMDHLDNQWLEFQDKCKNKSRSTREPSMEAVYRTMVAQNAIINKQRVLLASLVQRAQRISNQRLNLVSNLSLSRADDKEESELSRLAESLLEVKLGPSTQHKLSTSKQAKLRALLSDHTVVRIRPIRPKNGMSAILNLPPLRHGGISCGTPISATQVTKKHSYPSSNVQLNAIPPKSVVQQALKTTAGVSPFSFGQSLTPISKEQVNMKESFAFSTPNASTAFGLGMKTVKSLPKNLTDYYEEITPPKSPEPQVAKETESSAMKGFSFSKESETLPVKTPLMSLNNIVSGLSDSFGTKLKEEEKAKDLQSVDRGKFKFTSNPLTDVAKSSSILPFDGGTTTKETAPTFGTVASSVISSTPSFSFGGSATNVFGSTSVTKTVTSVNNITPSTPSIFGTLGSTTKPSATSIFGGSTTAISFGQPKISVPSSPKKAELSLEEPKEKKTELEAVTKPVTTTAVTSGFSFSLPPTTTPQPSILGQSRAQPGEKPSPVVAPPVNPTPGITYTINDVPSSPSKDAAKTTIITVSFPPKVPAVTTAPTSTAAAFSFAIPPTRADTEGATSASSSFFGQPICSPTSLAGGTGSLFGKSGSTTTIFGGATSIFGGTSLEVATPVASSTSTPSIFGGGISTITSSTSATSTTTPSVFGAKSSEAVATPLFGSLSAATTTASPLFGGSTTTTVAAPLFGATPTTATPLFGGTSVATTAEPLFGGTTVTTTAAPLFGGTSVTSSSPPLFGGTTDTSSAPPLFGETSATSTAAPLFGGTTVTSSAVPLFGGAAVTTTSAPILFGSTSTTSASLFGGTSTVTVAPLFGTSTQSTTAATSDAGLSSMFGSTSLFGAPSSSSATSSVFGGGTTTSAPSMFGQSSGSSTSVFGQTTTFGSSPAAVSFGVTPSAQGSGGPLFGAGSMFGSGGASPSVFGQSSALSTPLFGQSAASASPSIFGQSPSTPTSSSSLFGAASQQQGAFGQSPQQSVFGSSSSSAFGQSGGALFGQSSSNPSGGFGTSGSSVFGGGSPSVFGGSPSSPSSSGPFQSAGSPFGGASPSSGGGMFSSTTGQSISQSGFGGPAAFGSKPGGFGGTPVFGGGGGGFGAAPTFGATPAFGGAPAFGSSPTKMFGSTSPSASSVGFGSPTQQSSTFENLATQNTMSFGNLAQAQPQGFGSPQHQQQQTMFGSPQQNAAPSPPAFSGGGSFSSWR